MVYVTVRVAVSEILEVVVVVVVVVGNKFVLKYIG